VKKVFFSARDKIPEFFSRDRLKMASVAGRRTAMAKDTIIIAKIKAQLGKFSGIISKDFSTPKRRLIRELLYGIQATKDVKFSNISRSFNEEQPLIKTEDRLSRNIDDADFIEGINCEIGRLGGCKVLDDMVIALDPGDIRKRYASKMQYLCGIRDGSEREWALGIGYVRVSRLILSTRGRFRSTVRRTRRRHKALGAKMIN